MKHAADAPQSSSEKKPVISWKNLTYHGVVAGGVSSFFPYLAKCFCAVAAEMPCGDDSFPRKNGAAARGGGSTAGAAPRPGPGAGPGPRGGRAPDRGVGGGAVTTTPRRHVRLIAGEELLEVAAVLRHLHILPELLGLGLLGLLRLEQPVAHRRRAAPTPTTGTVNLI